MTRSRSTVTITACAGLSAALGSIHAFSVFIPEWENLPGASRANVSLIYSIALVSLTLTVLLGYRAYQRLSPPAIFSLVGVSAALGLWLSSQSPSLLVLYLCYGLIFGGANGLGYGYVLQLSGQAAPARPGLAMCLVTAFYAVGATIAPLPFGYLINQGGNALALQYQSVFIVFVALVCTFAVRWSNARLEIEAPESKQSLSAELKRTRQLLWLGYGSAVTAGLMIIGHAYGIALWLGFSAQSSSWATMIVAFGNMLGGFSAGYFSDRLASHSLLRWLPLASCVSLILLSSLLEFHWSILFFALGLVGYCYGAIIAVYPVAVARWFGALMAPRIYGQVFTAWGLAGLFGPWISGWLFDQTGSYTVSLLLAMLLSMISVVAIRLCPRQTAAGSFYEE